MHHLVQVNRLTAAIPLFYDFFYLMEVFFILLIHFKEFVLNQYQQKLLEDMLLKDFSVVTQKTYAYVVNAFLSRSSKFSLSEK